MYLAPCDLPLPLVHHPLAPTAAFKAAVLFLALACRPLPLLYCASAKARNRLGPKFRPLVLYQANLLLCMHRRAVNQPHCPGFSSLRHRLRAASEVNRGRKAASVAFGLVLLLKWRRCVYAFWRFITDMEQKSAENEQFFEPLGRCRSFTWHGHLNNFGAIDSASETRSPEVVIKSEVEDSGGRREDALNLKKPSARRNAWGCMSYADLITKAIESVPEKRLTLSQIYGWMIQNVPYFKDKGESNSSAGWKNSIRHNLSLHRKFMRVQNEGTGKSSWWMVNNEAKTCKSPRRRASSMDNKMYEKKKHRQTTLQSHVEEQNSVNDCVESNIMPSAAEVHKLDSFAMAFSPLDLRANGRTSGLSTSHLAPIEPIPETAYDNEVMTQPSPLYWNQCHSVNQPYGQTESLTETVGESLTELFTPDVNTSYEQAFSPDHRLTILQNVNEKYVSESGYLPFQDLGGTLPSPPPYVGHPAEQHCMPGDGIFPASGEVCPKEFLQQSPISRSQSDAFPAVQYGTRSSFRQGQMMPSDVATMQYYRERTAEEFATRADNNSVLRRMLMQNLQKNAQQSRFGDDTTEPVVKSEPGGCDSFAYPQTRSSLLCPGVVPGNLAYGDANSALRRQVRSGEVDQASRMKQSDSENGHRVIKQELCGDDSWEFNMSAVTNSALTNGSEN